MSRKKKWMVTLGLLTTALGAGVCARAWPPDPHTVVRTLTAGGREREYRLHVPPDLERDCPAPLVLVFHGGGSHALSVEKTTGFSALSDRDRFVVAYPNALLRNWNDGREPSATPAHAAGVDDLAFVDAVLDDVARVQAIDPARVYATGASNGAIFSHFLAVRRSERIAAIAPVIGGLADPFHREFRPARPVSVMIVQGTADPLVPYDGGAIAGGPRGRVRATAETARRWSEHDGCRAEATEETLPDRDPNDGCRVRRLSWTGGRDGTEVVLWRMEGGGHTWPNGPQYLPQGWIGRVCRDFDGSEAIWEFFRTHPRP